MKITINEVARRAGVSKSTVSRVMNNTKPVSEDIRQKVLDVIESTNFKPNATARSLSLSKSHLIGIILPDLSNPVFSRIISGIESYIRDKDYHLLITATDFDTNMKIEQMRILKDKGVDGLILVTDHGNEKFYEEMISFSKPIIMIGSDSTIPAIPVVKINNYKAACDATKYLLNLGHEKIGMIRGPLIDPQSGKERFEGFKDMLIQRKCYDESLVTEGWYTFDDGYKGMSVLLTQAHRPTAIFCACDLMAIGAMKCAMDNGLLIPEEISFVGFDDVDISRMYNPSLSTIKQPFEEIGRIAIEDMITMIERKSDEHHSELLSSHILPHHLIVRDSTSKLKK